MVTRPLRTLLATAALLAAGTLHAQDVKTTCAILLLHGKDATGQTVAPLGKKFQPACAARAPDMPWSPKRAAAKDEPMQEIARHVKELRQQGFKKVLVVGHGLGATAAMVYAGRMGDIEGVVAISADDPPSPPGALPTIAAGIKQHVPLLWLVGSGDPLHAKGETYAFLKAPPHPGSKYVAMKSDPGPNPEVAAKQVLDWVKALE